MLLPQIVFASQQVVDTHDHVYTYDEMCGDITSLAEKYPGKFSSRQIGTSADGRPIWQVVVGTTESKHAIFGLAATHAREWMNPWVQMASIEYYLKNWDTPIENNGVTYGQIFSLCPIYLVPMVNPDGVTFAQMGMIGIRSPELRAFIQTMPGAQDPTRWKANARGVDLNKNFPVGFCCQNETGTIAYSGLPASEAYPGLSPLSEPETQAVAAAASARHFDYGISFHSFGNAIYWDCGLTPEIKPRTYALAFYVSSLTGYRMGTPGTPHGLDYNYLNHALKIPTITIETGGVACPMPYAQFDKVYRSTRDVLVRTAKATAGL